jgi:hypothetical protein
MVAETELLAYNKYIKTDLSEERRQTAYVTC